MKLGILFKRIRSGRACRANRTVSAVLDYTRACERLPCLGFFGRASEFPEGETRLANFRILS